MKIKEEELFKEFNNKWSEDRKRIEEELTCTVSKCKALTENVDKMADMVVEKDAIVTAKELEVCRSLFSIVLINLLSVKIIFFFLF